MMRLTGKPFGAGGVQPVNVSIWCKGRFKRLATPLMGTVWELSTTRDGSSRGKDKDTLL